MTGVILQTLDHHTISIQTHEGHVHSLEVHPLVGFLNEFDVMRALESGKDLGKLVADDIMRKDPLPVTPSARIADAARRMEENHVFNLPVVDRNVVVAYSVSRHDLLRAWIGLGVGMGLDP